MSAITFLGCSVVSINSSAGFNGQTSSLQLELVEDPRQNQVFLPPSIGTPVYFNYGQFSFGGLLDSFDGEISTSGRTFSVSIVDPRDILSGVHLILGEYTGPTSQVPNVFNIYGHLENTYGFGYSGLTVDGTKWEKVVTGFNELLNNPSTFGGRISYKGYTFSMVLDNLPTIPPDYRISGDVSLLDFITDICETGNCDFLVNLTPEGPTGWRINVNVVSRQTQPSLGYISRFVATVPNASVRRSGLSRVNEINNRMLFGARTRDLEYVVGNIEKHTKSLYPLTSDPSNPSQINSTAKDYEITYFEDYDSYQEMLDVNILPYFGTDINRNAIVATGVGDWMSFNLDMRLISMEGLGESYTVTVGELRAALAGYGNWLEYLWNYGFTEYIPIITFTDSNGNKQKLYDGGGVFSDYDTAIGDVYGLAGTPGGNPLVGIPYSLSWDFIKFVKNASDIESAKYSYFIDDNENGVWKNPHFKKAFNLKLDMPPRISHQYWLTELDPVTNSYRMTERVEVDVRGSLRSPMMFKNHFTSKYKTSSELLWSYINKFAEQYYGHKFMIKVDGLKGVAQEDTLDVAFNKNAVDSGYINEDQIADAVANNLLPFSLQEFSDNNGLVQAFVRFDNFDLLDTSEMNEGNTFLNINYKKVNKSQKVAGPPYAFVKCQVEDIVFLDYANKAEPRVVISLPFIPYIKNELNPQLNNDQFMKYVNSYSRDNYDLNIISAQASKFATTRFGLREAYIFPDLVALPMESNQNRYGPWYVTGSDGPTELITDENLTPWNYNGYDNMNLVAEAILNDGPKNQVVETGSIEVPGPPALNIGSTLIAGGPYITDIQVNFDTNGVTTTYRLEIWKPRFGKMNKVFADKVSKIQRTISQLKVEKRGMIKTYLRNPNGSK